IHLINALIDHLVGQADAVIVNVSSGLAFVPLAKAPTYSASKAAIHAYTVALRAQLRGLVEVIELVPPAVRTELTPGQAMREGYMPLDEFMEETMGLFRRRPTPEEVLVERVGVLRHAEREGQFSEMVEALAGL